MNFYLILFAKKYIASYRGISWLYWQGIILMGINAFTIGVCFFLAIYFVNIQHFPPSISGLLMSGYGFGMVMGGVVAGKLCDQISPRIISIISLLGQSLAFFLLIYLQSARLLMADLILLGFAAYGFKTANNIRLLHLCKNDSKLRYRIISLSHIAANFGLSLSGIFIALLVSLGFFYIFYLSSCVLFFSAIYLFIQREKIVFVPSCEEVDIMNKEQISQLTLLVLFCVFLVGLIIAQLGSTYPLFIQDAFPDLGVKSVSILFILDTLLIVLFQAPLTNLFTEYNKIITTGLGALLMGLGMLILVWSVAFKVAVLSCIIWTAGEMLFISTAHLLCYEQSSPEKKGQNFGLLQSVYASSNVIGPTLGGAIYQYWGGNLLWYCSGLIGLLCFAMCFVFSKVNTYTSS